LHAKRRRAPGDLFLGAGEGEADLTDAFERAGGVFDFRLRDAGLDRDLRLRADLELRTFAQVGVDGQPEALRSPYDGAVEGDAVDFSLDVSRAPPLRRIERHFERGFLVTLEQRRGESCFLHARL